MACRRSVGERGGLPSNEALQDAVHDQVGIAADGRGEVGVARRGQREVALVLLAVSGLLERAQHQVAEDALFGLALDLARPASDSCATRCEMFGSASAISLRSCGRRACARTCGSVFTGMAPIPSE